MAAKLLNVLQSQRRDVVGQQNAAVFAKQLNATARQRVDFYTATHKLLGDF
jgi:hypothetical protein